MSRVYILLVNWNGWQDTLECLESVFRNDYPDYRVIVCDNGSTDGSLELIKGWAHGVQEVLVSSDNPLAPLSFPPVAKPIHCAEYSRTEAERGGLHGEDPQLVLIQTGGNLGFAGGNNVGLRYAHAREEFSYVWLLNNDTVIQSDALIRMVERMKQRPDAGMCGSLLPFYHEPALVWARGGGRYNPWVGVSRSIGYLEATSRLVQSSEVEPSLDYLAGASMLVSRAFLQQVGLLEERYFLFFEEPDWSMRGRGRFSLVYAPESIVYHKVGKSTGIADKSSARYCRSAWLSIRNRVLFTGKFFPFALPMVLLITVFQLMTLCATVAYHLLRSAGQGTKPH